jgi:hypothetical protein
MFLHAVISTLALLVVNLAISGPALAAGMLRAFNPGFL